MGKLGDSRAHFDPLCVQPELVLSYTSISLSPVQITDRQAGRPSVVPDNSSTHLNANEVSYIEQGQRWAPDKTSLLLCSALLFSALSSLSVSCFSSLSLPCLRSTRESGSLCFFFSLIPVFVWFTIDQLRLDQACQHNRYKSHLAGTVYLFSFFAVFVWDFLLRWSPLGGWPQ